MTWLWNQAVPEKGGVFPKIIEFILTYLTCKQYEQTHRHLHHLLNLLGSWKTPGHINPHHVISRIMIYIYIDSLVACTTICLTEQCSRNFPGMIWKIGIPEVLTLETTVSRGRFIPGSFDPIESFAGAG